jgi:Skp family chaperone for outer membrane proteins
MRYRVLMVLLGAAVGAAATATLAQTQTASPQAPAPPAAARPAKPFPDGFKVAVISPDRIIAESALGKASTGKISAIRAEKLAELNAKNHELESAREKLAIGSLLNEDARATVQKTIDRLQVELQRAQQDAEAAVQELQQQLNIEFERKLTPVVAQVALDRGIYVLLRVDTGTIAWADPALDLTSDIVKRLDTSTTPTVAKPPKDPQGPQPRP